MRPAPFRGYTLKNGPWEFDCRCKRCTSREDDCRGFLCPRCSSGVLRPRSEDLYWNFATWMPCPICGEAQQNEDLDAADEEWEKRVMKLPSSGEGCLDMFMALNPGSRRSRQRRSTLLPSLSDHWVAAVLSSQAAQQLLANGQFADAGAAAKHFGAFIRKVRPGVVTPLGVAALSIRAKAAMSAATSAAAQGQNIRARRAQGVARLLAEKALEEAAIVLDESEPAVISLRSLLEQAGEQSKEDGLPASSADPAE